MTQVRSGQLITTFGPGAMVDLPDESIVLGGTDSWEYDKSSPIPTIIEPRLQRKVEAQLDRGALSLRKPPAAIENKGFTPRVTGFKFPQWFIVQNSIQRKGHSARRLVHENDLEKGKFRDLDGNSYPVVPVRFVRACPKGHLGDIPWHLFVHGPGNDCRREMFLEERGTTGALESIWVSCACGDAEPLSRAAPVANKVLGKCDGARPWLGSGSRETCNEFNRLLIRSASNAYFPQVLTVISIPDSFAQLDKIVASLWDNFLVGVEVFDDLRPVLKGGQVKDRLKDYSPAEIFEAITRFRKKSSEERPIKEVEFEALSRAPNEKVTEHPEGDFFARALPEAQWQATHMDPVEKVILVHRLREVAALVAFTRFEAMGPDVTGEIDPGLNIKIQPAPVGLTADWVPAMENRGEGIFIAFKPEVIKAWLNRPPVIDRDRIHQKGLEAWIADHAGAKRKYPGLPYYLLHSLSHLVLNAISLECGYPASSIRERVYALPDQYGILLYTASPDAQGTLGGLVETGRRMKHHVLRALESGRLCSNDPVCSLHDPTLLNCEHLHGAACHGCLLISETSCEQRNDFLDRALVVPGLGGAGENLFA